MRRSGQADPAELRRRLAEQRRVREEFQRRDRANPDAGEEDE
ncbi:MULTISPECIES: hypothetical protein [unclassified Streptomyces]